MTHSNDKNSNHKDSNDKRPQNGGRLEVRDWRPEAFVSDSGNTVDSVKNSLLGHGLKVRCHSFRLAPPASAVVAMLPRFAQRYVLSAGKDFAAPLRPATRRVSTSKSCRRRSRHRFLFRRVMPRSLFALRRKSFPAERIYSNRNDCVQVSNVSENRKLNTSAIRRDCFSHTPPGLVQPPGSMNKGRDPWDRRASARLVCTATGELRSTVNLPPRHSSALAKSKPIS